MKGFSHLSTPDFRICRRMNGKFTAASPAPDSPPTPKKLPPRPLPLPKELELPTMSEAMDASTLRRWRVRWGIFGTQGYGAMIIGSVSLPGLHFFIAVIFFAPLFIVGMILVFYYAVYYSRISHLLPSKPVGRYAKHGFELAALTYALLVQWFHGGNLDMRFFGLMFVTGINVYVYTMYELMRHPADLGWLDFFLVEVMQFAVYAWGENDIHAVFATYMVCLVVICGRFYFYTCPETSDAPVGIVEKFGSVKAV